MSAKSQEEQDAARTALAVKRGEAQVSELNDRGRALYDTKTEEDLEELAGISREDKPKQTDD